MELPRLREVLTRLSPRQNRLLLAITREKIESRTRQK